MVAKTTMFCWTYQRNIHDGKLTQEILDELKQYFENSIKYSDTGESRLVIQLEKYINIRKPELDEQLYCAVCGGKCKKIDNEWLEYYSKIPDDEKKSVYDSEMDWFLSYDGCEDYQPEI